MIKKEINKLLFLIGLIFYSIEIFNSDPNETKDYLTLYQEAVRANPNPKSILKGSSTVGFSNEDNWQDLLVSQEDDKDDRRDDEKYTDKKEHRNILNVRRDEFSRLYRENTLARERERTQQEKEQELTRKFHQELIEIANPKNWFSLWSKPDSWIKKLKHEEKLFILQHLNAVILPQNTTSYNLYSKIKEDFIKLLQV